MNIMNKYKSNRNIVYSCKYHIVWCSKYRRKVLIGPVEKRLKNIINDVAKQYNVEIIEMETNIDHIHILCEVDPHFGVHKFIKYAKGRSSRILRNEFHHLKTKLPTLWTNSYFISTVGGVSLDAIKQYVENQQTSQREKEKIKWNRYIKRLK